MNHIIASNDDFPARWIALPPFDGGLQRINQRTVVRFACWEHFAMVGHVAQIPKTAMDATADRFDDLQTIIGVDLLNLVQIVGPDYGSVKPRSKSRTRWSTDGAELIGVQHRRVYQTWMALGFVEDGGEHRHACRSLSQSVDTNPRQLREPTPFMELPMWVKASPVPSPATP